MPQTMAAGSPQKGKLSIDYNSIYGNDSKTRFSQNNVVKQHSIFTDNSTITGGMGMSITTSPKH